MLKWLLILGGVAANALASVLVKAGPVATAPLFTFEGVMMRWRLIAAVACYGLAFVAYAAAVRSMPLNVAHPISTAGAIVLVGLASAMFFRESFPPLRIGGYLLLVAGIAALAMSGSEAA